MRLRIGVQVARRFADHRVGEDVRELAGELPGIEERHPVDVAEQLLERDSSRSAARRAASGAGGVYAAQSMGRRLARACAMLSCGAFDLLAGVLLATPLVVLVHLGDEDVRAASRETSDWQTPTERDASFTYTTGDL